MFRPMTAIFSRAGYLGLLLLLMACGEREPAVITPPKDAAAVIEPFLEKLRKGDKAGAATHVSTAATDELDKQFAADSKALAAAGKLTARFVTETRKAKGPMGEEISSDGDEVTLVYAARKDSKWTTATVRVYRYRDEPYKVEYWRVNNAVPAPQLPSGIDAEVVKTQQQMMFITFAALSVFGIAGLALLFWIIRRKPHLVVNEAPSEERQAASTVRDE
jgi:hypothetical protein